MRRLVYHLGNGNERIVDGTNVNGWKGWGYVVMHYAATGDTSQGHVGEVTRALTGTHHARFEYHVRMYVPSAVDVTFAWLIATGRSHPLYSITFDATPSGENAVQADTRTPYGDVTFDGITSNTGEVSGLGWGDAYRFDTTGASPATMFSSWDYTVPNTIPFVRMWSVPADAEQGAVTTQRFADGLAGGDYASLQLALTCHGRTSLTKLDGCGGEDYDGGTPGPYEIMPQAWLWPFQLSQWELHTYGGTTSKRLAWGANYGAVGQTTVSSLGRSGTGYPFLSYAVRGVFGPHTADTVLGEVRDVEAIYATTLTASVGTVRTHAIGGVARTDLVTLAHPGYNPIFDTFEVEASAGKATVTLSAPNQVAQPMFRIFERPTLPVRVAFDGVALTADQHYFATVEGSVLWLTLNFAVSGTHSLSIE